MDDIPMLMNRISDLLMHIWSETGFGSLVIDSERINGGDKIRVIIRGGVFYKYIIMAPVPQTERQI